MNEELPNANACQASASSSDQSRGILPLYRRFELSGKKPRACRLKRSCPIAVDAHVLLSATLLASLGVSPSLCVSLSLSLSFYLCLILSLSLCLSLSLSFRSLSLSLYMHMYISLSLSLSLSLSMSHLHVVLYLSMSLVSLYLSLSLCLCPCLSVSFCLCVPTGRPCRCLFLPASVSLSLPRFLSSASLYILFLFGMSGMMPGPPVADAVVSLQYALCWHGYNSHQKHRERQKDEKDRSCRAISSRAGRLICAACRRFPRVVCVLRFIARHPANMADQEPKEMWEFAPVAEDWLLWHDMPANQHWKPLPPLQVQRVEDGDQVFWHGDVRLKTFKSFHFVMEHEGSSLWRSRSGSQYVLRKSPMTTLVLNLSGDVQGENVCLQGRSMAGRILYESTWPVVSTLTCKMVHFEARAILVNNGIMRNTQKLKLVGPGGCIEPNWMIWNGKNTHKTTSSQAYTKKTCRRKLTRKSDLRKLHLQKVYIN